MKKFTIEKVEDGYVVRFEDDPAPHNYADDTLLEVFRHVVPLFGGTITASGVSGSTQYINWINA